jgi:SAM-dependent methyltransferase
MNAYQLLRIGPVHFQPLEWEMQQVRQYIKGKVLNAGCGNRDLGDILRGFGAGEIINYDIESSIPGAIRGSLIDTPFASDEFDTIICNAVLEHVPEIDCVMRELTRVLKPGGYFVASVPFLQPYHRSPTDFRRYTSEGLEEIGRLHGLRTVEILPVHTITQTLGWIAWEWAKEKGGWRVFAVFPIVWLATRLFYKTDMKVRNHANTFQAVYTKEIFPGHSAP